ncbi:PucR family transcriptional regulator [Streptomyces sp. NPDC088789]|uniref:PucR family transcriptional regulator n=1 Tax=Streptomyces sp. NPDC088789 TaxID=3365899 RepID=UPI003819039A
MPATPATIQTVLDLPHLRLSLFSGAAGLGREVSWAHASDLDSPWDWMAGGELLMRNGRTLPAAGGAQAALVERCAEAGASGILIGEDPDTPELSHALAAAADRHSLAVLRAAYSVSFVAVSRAVADANTGETSARFGQIEKIYGALRDSLASRTGDSPTARLGRELGCRLLLLDTATANPVDPAGTAPDPALRRAVLAAVSDHDGHIPGVLHVPFPGGPQVLAVEVPGEEPTVLVTVGLPGSDTSLLHHLATAAAVETAQQGMLREHERRLGSELLAQLLDSRAEAKAAHGELAAHRLPPDRLVLLAVRHENSAEQRDLHLTLSRRRVAHLLLNRGDLLMALLSDDPGDLAVVQRRLGPHTPTGLSARTSPDRISEARDEAVWSLSLARGQSGGGPVRYGDETAFTVLRSLEEARAIVERVLGPLLSYDRANGTELTGTLRSFLVHRRSWQRTAAALNVHKQTVMYRVQRVEELTDRTLAETADITELWIAFQAYALLHGESLS